MAWQGITAALVGGLASPINAIGNVLDKIFTSDEEELSKAIIMQRLMQQPHMAQTEINKIEAQHRTIFVAGWRPFIGWVCGLSIMWKFVGYDLASWICNTWYPHVEPPELTGTGMLLELVIGMLGLGGMRTWEKLKGKAE